MASEDRPGASPGRRLRTQPGCRRSERLPSIRILTRAGGPHTGQASALLSPTATALSPEAAQASKNANGTTGQEGELKTSHHVSLEFNGREPPRAQRPARTAEGQEGGVLPSCAQRFSSGFFPRFASAHCVSCKRKVECLGFPGRGPGAPAPGGILLPFLSHRYSVWGPLSIQGCLWSQMGVSVEAGECAESQAPPGCPAQTSCSEAWPGGRA